MQLKELGMNKTQHWAIEIEREFSDVVLPQHTQKIRSSISFTRTNTVKSFNNIRFWAVEEIFHQFMFSLQTIKTELHHSKQA